MELLVGIHMNRKNVSEIDLLETRIAENAYLCSSCVHDEYLLTAKLFSDFGANVYT